MGGWAWARRTCFVLSLLAAAPVRADGSDATELASRRKDPMPRTGGPRFPQKAPAIAYGSDGFAANTRRKPQVKPPPPRTGGPRLPTKMLASTAGRAVDAAAHGMLAEPSLPVSLASDAGEYADSLDALGTAATAFERSPEAGYSYCLRVTATYESVYYGHDGQLRRAYARAVQHGTGFAFKKKDGDYFVATNEHVSGMPEVTDAEHPVDGVPVGSRKVRESIRIVRNEEDEYAAGQIELTKVVTDPALDVAILKTRHPLNVMPYRLGHSAALRVGNVVVGRGFPLGVFASSNVGRVTNARQEDADGTWDHVDFMTDAALNNGNSGSPVFAISRKTHEYELVGVFHAHYKQAQGMGVVVGIDALKDFFETLTPTKRTVEVATAPEQGAAMLAAMGRELYFPFGGLVARASPVEGGTRFDVFQDFPVSEDVEVSLVSGTGESHVDLPALTAGAVPVSSLEPSLRDSTAKLERELWSSLTAALSLRGALAGDDGTPRARKQVASLRKRLTGRTTDQRDILAAMDYAREQVALTSGEAAHFEPGAK